MVEWSIEALRGGRLDRRDRGRGAAGRRRAHLRVHRRATCSSSTAARPASESVANALERVETDLVAIHDAARPLVTSALVDEVVQTLVEDRAASGAVAAAPVTDTIKRAAAPEAETESTRAPLTPHEVVNGARLVRDTLDRRELWAVQTPQVFRVDALRRAFEADPEEVAEATDEAMLVEAAGGRVLIHASAPENIKVTTELDLRLANVLIRDRTSG